MDDVVIQRRISQMQRAYDALSLKTMRKVTFSQEQWVTLARFNLDKNDKIARDNLPVDLAFLTDKTLDELKAYGVSQKMSVRQPPMHLIFGSTPCWWWLPSLANDLRKDFATLSRVFNRDPLWRRLLCVDKLELQSGRFRLARDPRLHTDKNWTGTSASLLVRTHSAPTLYCAGDVYEKATDEQRDWLDTARRGLSHEQRTLAIRCLIKDQLLAARALGAVTMIALDSKKKVGRKWERVEGNFHCSTPIDGGSKESTFLNFMQGSYVRFFSRLQRLELGLGSN